jgi:hypothetical protein
VEIKAILFRKELSSLYITAVEMDEARACVIKIDSDMGSF